MYYLDKNKIEKCMFYVGVCLHLIQDSTVPQHGSGDLFKEHRTFELWIISKIYDEDKFNKSAYESIISIFKIDNHPINPIKFIEDRKNKECLEVCAYIISKIDLEKIKSIIYDLPESYNGIKVISKIQKDFYYRAFCLRLNKIKDIINVNDNLTSLNI